MNADEHAEIAASIAAHAELGPRYDAAVAEGLIERIGEEIDRRVDARLGAGDPAAGAAPRTAPPAPVPPAGPAAAPAARRAGYGITGLILGLGSIGLGVGATAAVASHHANAIAQVLMIALIWAAIAAINKSHASRR